MAEPQAESVAQIVDNLIQHAIAARASDVHFEPTDQSTLVRFRVDSLLTDVAELPRAIAPNVVARLKVLSGLLTYRTDIPQEGAIDHTRSNLACDVRVATFPTIRGERAVLRIMRDSRQILTLDDLGHGPELVSRLEGRLTAPQGLIIVCGPAGSGKTTTLYAMLNFILRQRGGISVLSVEDPVEMRIDRVTQIQLEPARGLTYPVALRSLLRQDPQVLMIGEIRDSETAHIAIEAALTGHLLLTTLHSGTPAEAIVRLREMGIPAYQLTSTIQAIIAQRLVRTTCRDCAGCIAASTSAAPCAACLGTGYSGRSAIGSLFEITPEIRKSILDGADVSVITGGQHGLRAIQKDADRLLESGRTTADEIQRVLGNAAV